MASWTSTSPISGSVWDGPSGCPIISPSNWTEQVLDNLTVLANHNHSGSAGEGISIIAASFFPTIDDDYFSAMFPVASAASGGGSASLGLGQVNNTPFLWGGIRLSGCGTQAEYDVYLRQGVYSVGVFLFVDADTTAQANIYIDSACIGQVTPLFANQAAVRVLTGASITGAGERRLIVQNVTTGSVIISAFSIRRTAALD